MVGAARDGGDRDDGSSGALDRSVLVLNRYYAPVHVTTARRAFTLLWKAYAEAIDVFDNDVVVYDLASWLARTDVRDGDDLVTTVTLSVRVPRIVRLTRFDRLPRTRVAVTRKSVIARDDDTCQYCGHRPGRRDLTIDHIVPRSRGGGYTFQNLVACCRRCNDRKGDRTPDESGMRLLRRPVTPRENPLLHRKLEQRRYQSWRLFLPHEQRA